MSLFKRFRAQKTIKTDTTKKGQLLLVSAGLLRELSYSYNPAEFMAEAVLHVGNTAKQVQVAEVLSATKCWRQSSNMISHQIQIEAMALWAPGEFWAT